MAQVKSSVCVSLTLKYKRMTLATVALFTLSGFSSAMRCCRVGPRGKVLQDTDSKYGGGAKFPLQWQL